MSSPMLLHQNSELYHVVQKVTPMTIVQDLNSIIEENPRRVLLTTIYQIIGELKVIMNNFNVIFNNIYTRRYFFRFDSQIMQVNQCFLLDADLVLEFQLDCGRFRNYG